ncbi:hypothetical protein DLREEDagrD3_02530 [Denitratisoma sp. agr-D3]
MKNDKTHHDDYKGFSIGVLMLCYENGWTIEVEITGQDTSIPRWRDNDTTYKTEEEARDAGINWAKAFIDETIPSNN